MCTQAQLSSETFQKWVPEIKETPMRMHRKIWEYCYIIQALAERNMLEPGRRGLGFAVGQEPISALLAKYGCQILATDLDTENADKGQWVETGQHAANLESLNARGICPPDLFRERVNFRFMDMRHLPPPAEVGQFDFLWSSCSLEHLGTMELGEQFIFESLKYLRPGGFAVHTTEFNFSSNLKTQFGGADVLFRKRDLIRIARRLRREGHRITLDFTKGNGVHDKFVDKPPFAHVVHLRLQLYTYIVTSYGFIIQKGEH